MKKCFIATLALTLVLALAGCGNGGSEEPAAPAQDEKSEGVMTYAEYEAAELNTQVVIEAYVQAKQSWYQGNSNRENKDTATGALTAFPGRKSRSRIRPSAAATTGWPQALPSAAGIW